MATRGVSRWQVMTVNELGHILGVVPGMLPLAGEDDADRCLGVGLADAHEERIHIEKHGAERHAGDEAELVSARAKAATPLT